MLASPEALVVIDAEVNMSRSHPSAPALDVFDVATKGRAGQVLNFIEVGVRNGSVADLASDFGQLVARL